MIQQKTASNLHRKLLVPWYGQFAKEYMHEMGIGNTQYIVVRHHNTDNNHLHIFYNRIDNDLKLISVNKDHKRNIQVYKKLKDKYILTYATGKERVKLEKLNHPDKAKYQIYVAVRATIVNSSDYKTLESLLKPYGVSMQFKHRRGTDIIEGVSFAKNCCSFKDRSDEFVKYGHYEIRKMHKRLIEAGYITKEKAK